MPRGDGNIQPDLGILSACCGLACSTVSNNGLGSLIAHARMKVSGT